jgi:O-antigen/teichoic acid export membrane protein/GT2 family glycosyltransferase
MSETVTKPNGHLTSGRLLARNVVWNLLGTVAPLFVAVFAVPRLIHAMGTDRFGVLTLAWALIGYASLFDLGLGRALTQLVAKKLGAGEEREIPSLAWTSLLLMTLLGLAGTASILLISSWLAGHGLNVPAELQRETLQSFRVLALSLPFVITTAGLRGLLEAHQRFGLISALRIPMGVFTFAGPLLVLPFSKGLLPVIAVLVAGRVAAWALHLLICLRVVPELRRSVDWEHSVVGPLLRFGGWMTVTNVVGPLMLYVDRFVIGALVSATAVAYYATPYEVVTKLFVVTGAISAVMFPAFSMAGSVDRGRSSMLYRRAMVYMFAGLLPVTAVLLVGARPGLSLWLGADFASHSYRVAQLLLLGTFALAMESLPFVLIQGLGRPDIPAKLNLVEIPFYAVGLYWLIRSYGVTGAAEAWAFRAAIDAILLVLFAHRLQKKPSSGFSTVPEVSVVTAGPSRENVCAIVVTYFPAGDLLSRLRRIQRQVAQVVVVDNGSAGEAANSLPAIESELGAAVIRNGRNLGIATALNQGARWAAERSYPWILTFDQDSEVDLGMVESLTAVYRSREFAEKVAVVGANFRQAVNDKPFYDFSGVGGKSYRELETVITSGSLMSLDVFQVVGGFRDDFFIDCVDLEYCLRARAHGFRVILTSQPLMRHSIGNASEHNLGWRKTAASNYAPIRHYFITRNTLILAREYILREPAWILNMLWVRIKALLLTILFESELQRKIHFCALGFLDGIRNRTGRFA